MACFFLNLKMEWVWQRDYASFNEAKRDVTDYIRGLPQLLRLHSRLGYPSPALSNRKGQKNNLSLRLKILDHYPLTA